MPDHEAVLRLADNLEWWSQNEEMIDQHFTKHGRDCNAAAKVLRELAALRERVEALSNAVADLDVAIGPCDCDFGYRWAGRPDPRCVRCDLNAEVLVVAERLADLFAASSICNLTGATGADTAHGAPPPTEELT